MVHKICKRPALYLHYVHFVRNDGCLFQAVDGSVVRRFESGRNVLQLENDRLGLVRFHLDCYANEMSPNSNSSSRLGWWKRIASATLNSVRNQGSRLDNLENQEKPTNLAEVGGRRTTGWTRAAVPTGPIRATSRCGRGPRRPAPAASIRRRPCPASQSPATGSIQVNPVKQTRIRSTG